MSSKTDTQPLCDPFLDRRCKLLPCQKELIQWIWVNTADSITKISKRFRVDRRTVIFILFPEELEKNKQARKERGGHRVYYDRSLHCKAVKEHRSYKKKLLK